MKINSLKLLVLTLLISACKGDLVHIALLDTEFCQHAEKSIMPVFDATDENATDEHDECHNGSVISAAIHGERVLQIIMKDLPEEIKDRLVIHPIKVFRRKDGTTSIETWKKALARSVSEDISIIATAASLISSGPLPDPPQLSDDVILFAAAGTVSDTVMRSDFLWPQALNRPNSILVGHYMATDNGLGQFDTALLHQSQIAYFIKSEFDSPLSGSSHALAKLVNFSLRHCIEELASRQFDKLSKCLQELALPLSFLNLPAANSDGKVYKELPLQ